MDDHKIGIRLDDNWDLRRFAIIGRHDEIELGAFGLIPIHVWQIAQFQQRSIGQRRQIERRLALPCRRKQDIDAILDLWHDFGNGKQIDGTIDASDVIRRKDGNRKRRRNDGKKDVNRPLRFEFELFL